MDTGNVIAIVGGAATVVLAAGALLTKVAGLDARINKLEAGQADQGRRIGETHATVQAMSEARKVEREYEREHRRSLTGAHKADE